MNDPNFSSKNKLSLLDPNLNLENSEKSSPQITIPNPPLPNLPIPNPSIPESAYTLIVDTLVDENDGDLSAGDLSLREALLNVPSGGIIKFDSDLAGGTITLKAPNDTDPISTGELLIDKAVFIDGLGADKLTIDANQTNRIFNISGGSPGENTRDNSILTNKVEIHGITITGGKASEGGGIRNTGHLILQDTVLKNNSANTEGGGIFNYGGELTLIDSQIINNFAEQNGGGISTGFELDNFNGDIVRINNSIIANNETNGNGGGVYVGQAGQLFVNGQTEIIQNNGSNGGGLYNAGNSVINLSTIAQNTALENGGGIYSIDAQTDRAGSFRIDQSSVFENIAANGGGLAIDGNALEGQPDWNGRAAITNTAIYDNSSNNTGGGIWVGADGDLDILNSTISSNNADFDGGGIYMIGGGTTTLPDGSSVGDLSQAANLTLRHSTLILNQNTDLADSERSDITIRSSILQEIDESGGGYFAMTSSFIGGLNRPIFSNDDLLDVLRLSTLQDNGGPTLTHVLLTGSPLIDASGFFPSSIASDVFDDDNDGDLTEDVPFDQRGSGFSRIAGDWLDIGAFEAQIDGNDVLRGRNSDDTLIGGGGDDVLKGRKGNDTLVGGDGDDLLIGGRGRDKHRGGAGDDTFRFKRADLKDRPDVIFDFEIGADVLDVSRVFKGNRFRSDTPLDDFVRVKGSSKRTVVRVDFDGVGEQQKMKPLAILKGLDFNVIDANSFIV